MKKGRNDKAGKAEKAEGQKDTGKKLEKDQKEETGNNWKEIELYMSTRIMSH